MFNHWFFRTFSGQRPFGILAGNSAKCTNKCLYLCTRVAIQCDVWRFIERYWYVQRGAMSKKKDVHLVPHDRKWAGKLRTESGLWVIARCTAIFSLVTQDPDCVYFLQDTAVLS